MRNRLKKSHRNDSISSTRSGNRHSQDGKQADSAHHRTPSAPADVPPASPADTSGSTMGTSSRGANSGRGGSSKPLNNPAVVSSSSSPSLLPLSASQVNSGASASKLSRTLSIRAVTSFDDKPRLSFDDETSSVGSPSVTQHSNSAFSSSVNSNGSTASSSNAFSSQNEQNELQNDTKSQVTASKSRAAQSVAATTSQPGVSSPPHLAVPGSVSTARLSDQQRKGSGGFGIPAGASSGARAVFSATATAGTSTASGDGTMADDGSGGGGGAWDSTIGKAGLGKTGRVINRLVSDNEALKRDLQIERLKADEARQAARLLEDKMERLVSDYETRLLEASVTKTLLARKERQVESLQGAVELEKKRTADAQERERSWRTEMDKVRTETKRQVEEAVTQAALMESRYEAISSHWRDQGEDVRRAAGRMGKEVRELAAARRQDDDKINMLRDLCDQQDGNIKVLREQKEAIAEQFLAYKEEQEMLLHAIKTNGAAREAEQERTLEEARQVLDKLKWALNIKETIPWAQ